MIDTVQRRLRLTEAYADAVAAGRALLAARPGLFIVSCARRDTMRDKRASHVQGVPRMHLRDDCLSVRDPLVKAFREMAQAALHKDPDGIYGWSLGVQRRVAGVRIDLDVIPFEADPGPDDVTAIHAERHDIARIGAGLADGESIVVGRGIDELATMSAYERLELEEFQRGLSRETRKLLRTYPRRTWRVARHGDAALLGNAVGRSWLSVNSWLVPLAEGS